MLTAFIADDQPLARERLRDLLANVDFVDCVGEAGSGETTIELVDRLQPDLLFLDVRMPSLSGIEVARRLQHQPLIVFTTAYDQFAVTAFELQAVDYLLKPFGRERLMETLDRAKAILDDRQRLAELASLRADSPNRTPLRRIFVRSRGKIGVVMDHEIEHVEAQGDYVTIWTEDRDYLIRTTMAALEADLDRDRFLRVHRSHIVNLDRVHEIVPHGPDRFAVELQSGKTVVASRRGSRTLRKKTRQSG